MFVIFLLDYRILQSKSTVIVDVGNGTVSDVNTNSAIANAKTYTYGKNLYFVFSEETHLAETE